MRPVRRKPAAHPRLHPDRIPWPSACSAAGPRSGAPDRPRREIAPGTPPAHPKPPPKHACAATAGRAVCAGHPVEGSGKELAELRFLSVASGYRSFRYGECNPLMEIVGQAQGSQSRVIRDKCRAEVLQRSGERRAVTRWYDCVAQRMAAKPVRAVQRLELICVRNREFKQQRLACQPIQLGRFDPRIAIGAQVSGSQAVDNQNDCTSLSQLASQSHKWLAPNRLAAPRTGHSRCFLPEVQT